MEERKTTNKRAVAIAKAKEALRAILREACQDERISEEIENCVMEGLYEMVEDAARAYAACRAYAWSGLGVSYELTTKVDSAEISAMAQRRSNGIRDGTPSISHSSTDNHPYHKIGCLFATFYRKIKGHNKQGFQFFLF